MFDDPALELAVSGTDACPRLRAAPADSGKLRVSCVNAGDTTRATLTVRAGDEVVQLYLRPLDPRRPRALKELRGVERITLKPGESRVVTFAVTPSRDLTIYDEARTAYVVDPGRFELQIGASSADVRAKSVFTVTN